MTFSQFVGIAASCAMLVQIILMGFIGYPIARRRPGGMAAFRSSGFLWWVFVLVLVSFVGTLCIPGSVSWNYPSQHGPSIVRLVVGSLVGFGVCLFVELVAERIVFGRLDSVSRKEANAKYEGALPAWAREGLSQYCLLIIVALLEEFVFRSVALGSFLYEWSLPKAAAAGIVAVAFGFSHWYYGFRQVAIKLIVGSVLVWAALTGGWGAAALAHMLLNVSLTVISARRKNCKVSTHD